MPRTPSPAMCIAQIEKGDTVEIKKVDRGTELADKLLRFVEEFSWELLSQRIFQEREHVVSSSFQRSHSFGYVHANFQDFFSFNR